jgi:hypothetical protein
MAQVNARKAARQINVNEVRAALDQHSRDPFKALLSEVLGSAPTPEAVYALAQRNPDRYGQLLAIVARLAGYSDKVEVAATVTAKLDQMSDAELEQRISELHAKHEAGRRDLAAAEPPHKRPRRAKSGLVLIDPPPAQVDDGDEAA